MRVPDWLAHLRSDSRGRPVPYINRWGPEQVERLSIAYDPNIREMGVFFDDSREHTPDFTAQHMGRQRECMTRGLCQVCGRPVPAGRHLLVLSAMSTRVVDVDGMGAVTVVSEPWLDERCARFALGVCPALLRRRTGEDLSVLLVRDIARIRLVISRGWIDGPLEAESKRVQPALWVKVMVPADLTGLVRGAVTSG